MGVVFDVVAGMDLRNGEKASNRAKIKMRRYPDFMLGKKGKLMTQEYIAVASKRFREITSQVVKL